MFFTDVMLTLILGTKKTMGFHSPEISTISRPLYTLTKLAVEFGLKGYCPSVKDSPQNIGSPASKIELSDYLVTSTKYSISYLI